MRQHLNIREHSWRGNAQINQIAALQMLQPARGTAAPEERPGPYRWQSAVRLCGRNKTTLGQLFRE
jgi:hypothetical protein